MIRIVVVAVIASALYLLLMGDVQRRDEITLQQAPSANSANQ